jgi:predicted kinase
MKPKLTLIRGLPGSGKSTMARKIAVETGALHVEADMWVDYSHRHESEAVKRAHAICQSQARRALAFGGSVVVSNTFTRQWEMQPYLDMAHQYGAQVEIITATGDYGSVHGVPESAIKAMRERWEEVAL